MSDTKKILEEIKKTKSELKNIIEASEARLLLKLEEGNQRIKLLEEENRELKLKLEQTERRLKKNNLIIFGLEKQEKDTNFLCAEIKKVLKVDLSASEINNFYSLGKQPKAPLKLELVSYLTKQKILKNTKLLKGTGIFIAEDLTYQQRQEQRALKTYLNEARASQHYKKSFIRGNKLVVDNVKYTLDDLKEAAENKEGEHKQHSAPNTPILDKIPPLDFNKEHLEIVNHNKSTPKNAREERERKGSRSGLRSLDKQQV